MKFHKMQQSKFGLPVTATGCTRHYQVQFNNSVPLETSAKMLMIVEICYGSKHTLQCVELRANW